MVPYGTLSTLCYLMVPYGTLWYLMVPYGTSWYLMVPYGALWYLVVLYGTLWYLMVPYGTLWYHMVPYGSLWYLMVPYGTIFQLKTKKYHNSTQELFVFNDFWTRMKEKSWGFFSRRQKVKILIYLKSFDVFFLG